MKRGNYLRLSLLALFSGILGFILISFLIFFAYVLSDSDFYSAPIITFFAGLVLLIIGVLCAIRAVAVSYTAVIHEMRSEQY